MTLIKINIENKDKKQQKLEILNKLSKIQSIVNHDKNYNELIYNIITNATIQKKNMKVNLDKYGNYSVIDFKNKIVGGGLYNSQSINVRVNENVPVHIGGDEEVPVNFEKNVHVPVEENVPVLVDEKEEEKVPVLVDEKEEEKVPVLVDEKENEEDSVPVDEKEDEEVPVLVDEKEEEKVSMPVYEKEDEEDSVPVDEKEEEKVSVPVDEKEEGEGEGEGEEEENTHSEKPNNNLFSKITGFLTGGNKDQYSSDEEEIAYNKYKTMMFHQEDEDEGLMQHMKNMTSKKYLTTLTSQDLKDIMKNNQMKVTNNGSYYNKKEMISKIVKFYK